MGWNDFMLHVWLYARTHGYADVLDEAFTGDCDGSEECRRCVERVFNYHFLKWLWIREDRVIEQLLLELRNECLGGG